MVNFNDIYTTDLLNQKKETVKGADVLKGKLVMLYFSAHWCPPCRGFTPVLKTSYEEWIANGKPVAIVFVTSDRDEQSFWDYFTNSHADYYALPFGSPMIQFLKEKYKVTGIPSLVVVKENGDVIDAGGRGKIQENDKEAVDKWIASSK